MKNGQSTCDKIQPSGCEYTMFGVGAICSYCYADDGYWFDSSEAQNNNATVFTICKQCIDGCQWCEDSTNCLKCFDGYNINEDGT